MIPDCRVAFARDSAGASRESCSDDGDQTALSETRFREDGVESYCHSPLLLPVICHHFADKHRSVKVKLVRITIERRGIDVDIPGSCAFFTAYRSQHLASLPVK